MAIEIVYFPIKHGDFPLLCQRSPEGMCQNMWLKICHKKYVSTFARTNGNENTQEHMLEFSSDIRKEHQWTREVYWMGGSERQESMMGSDRCSATSRNLEYDGLQWV